MNSRVLITGGAGFIGCNVAHRLLSEGSPVLILDNLSRHGVLRNVEWLKRTHGSNVKVVPADVRDWKAVREAVDSSRAVFHFAGQTAVTTSLVEPLEDFEVNARGTLNVLEAIRKSHHRPPVFFTSTNKVYGDLGGQAVRSNGMRDEPEDYALGTHGFDEQRNLNFHSPYGCSKGTADQYVLDYARSFGLQSVVFRMSCIYGPHQCGTEDQGWVAHFLISALRGDPLTIYGSGCQVRDILFCRRPGRGVPRGLAERREDQRPSLQHWRWSRQYDQPAGTARLAQGDERRKPARAIRPVAGGRSALLRLRYTEV